MCGICGVLGPIDEATLRAMMRAIAHRGPDDEGLFLAAGVGLGVRRLSIIDLAGGHQPVTNEDGTVGVVFNGEIYNYRTLRDQLAKRGHGLATHSDTEVLVHLYEDYGEAGAHLLRGMFAYAIWDARRRRLLLVRDRMGIKPLYYTLVGSSLVFASEVKSLLAYPPVRAELDPEALDLYLTLQYVPGERTMFRGIRKLLPGHMLIAADGHVKIQRYWDVVFDEGPSQIDLDEAAEEFLQLFTETVRLHLVGDVPVGVLLSGGIDSSAIVGTMARLSAGRVRTFTVGFDMPGMHDERDDARLVARHFGTEHHEIVVRPDAAELLPKLLWHLDEPVADPAALPAYLLCRFARENVPVVLTGEGGDELLAGYPRYFWFLVARRLQRALPRAVRERILLPVLVRLPTGSRHRKWFNDLLAELSDVARHVRWIGNLNPELKARLVSPDLRRRFGIGPEDVLAEFMPGPVDSEVDLVHKLTALDMRTWLVDDILTKMDRMSMATSVEARVPFLDHRLVEFVAGLPVALKVRTLATKQLLRESMRGLLPRHTLERRKQPFSVPVSAWLRGPLRDFVHDVLLAASAARGWLERSAVQDLVDTHARGDERLGQPLWNLLCLELWARAFLDGRATGSAG